MTTGAGGRFALISRAARTPELRRVNLAFLGYSISEHGTWLAVAVFALANGGPATVGVVAAAQLLPSVLLTPFSSYAGDRFPPHRALAVGYAVQCLSMAATAAAMAADRPLVAYVAGAVAATAISFTRPIMGSLMPIVTHAPADLVAANVVCGIIEQCGLFVGPVLAGVLLATSSPASVFVLGAVLTGLGCLAVATLRVLDDAAPTIGSGSSAIGQVLGGFRALHHAPMLRVLLLFVVAGGITRGVGDVVFVSFAAERLGGGGGASGYLAVTYGVGGLVAAATATRLTSGARTNGQFLAAIVAGGAALMVLAVASSYLSGAVGFAMLGAADAVLMITAIVTIQRVAPMEVLARLFGIVEGLQMGFVAVGASTVSFLIPSTSLGRAFVVMAVVVVLVSAVGLLLLVRRGHAVPDVDEAIVVRLLADPVLAPLAAPTVERLARGARRMVCHHGTEIVAEREHGDRYYLVVAGEVSISVAGEHVRVLGPGTSFGEIALLRDVPRTATATAVGRVDLITISRDEFLEAVTGHPRSLSTASEVADRWLGA